MNRIFKIIFLTFIQAPFLALARLTPVAGTAIAVEVDRMNNFIHLLSLFFGLAIIAVFIIFTVLYQRKQSNETGTATVHHNSLLEFTWSFIPFLIFMGMFGWGWFVYHKMRTPPKNSLEIHAYGQMWNWDYVYKNGRKSQEGLYVPINRDVKLILTSRDVIHSFSIPAFRIKQDVVPGRYTALWFRATKEGSFHVFCTEYCGTGHYNMLSKVNVMKLKDWEKWLASDPYKDLSMAEIGKKVFKGRCTACHSTGSTDLIGPGLKGIIGSKRLFTDGSSQMADENYIRESILSPSAKVVSGYPNQMTSFAGLLQEDELAGLIEYIKSLK